MFSCTLPALPAECREQNWLPHGAIWVFKGTDMGLGFFFLTCFFPLTEYFLIALEKLFHVTCLEFSHLFSPLPSMCEAFPFQHSSCSRILLSHREANLLCYITTTHYRSLNKKNPNKQTITPLLLLERYFFKCMF